MEETLICVLCDEEITENEHGWAGGNNPAPLASEGRCCDACNVHVIMARLTELI
tara:strand:- start:2128 stop:2289 length:162 start_codon:yes stop_codon:yes gene_type:complete